MDLYAENILDHFRDPRNTGSGQEASSSGTADNPACGDELTVHLWIKDDVIQKVEWEGSGCAISQAAMSMLSEELEGMRADDVMNMNKDFVYELLGVPIGPRRFKCALMCLHTVKNTVQKYKGEEMQSWLETVGV